MKKVRLQSMTSVIFAAIGALTLLATGCNTKEPKYEQAVVSVDQSQITIPNEGGSGTVLVTTNRSWTVSFIPSTVTWIATTPDTLTYVNGNGKLSFTVAPNQSGTERTVTLAIHASSATAYVTITQGNSIGDVIYNESFGTPTQTYGTSSNQWPYMDQYPNPAPPAPDQNSFQRTGPGAATVTYGGSGSSVRTSTASSGYTGATGSGNAFFGGSAAGGTFIINDITVSGNEALTLKFGISDASGSSSPYFVAVTPSTITLEGSVDGGANWTKITYTNDATVGWVLASAPFNVAAGSDKLSLRFTANGTNIRVDDVSLYQGGGSSSVVIGGGGGGTPPAPTNAIYNETFGTAGKTATPYDYVDQYTGWDKSGTGVANVTYAGANTSIRANATKVSTGYTDASGGSFLFFGAVPASFTVKDIDITGNETMTVSFGVSDDSATASPYWVPVTSSTITVSYSVDAGNTWLPLTFTNAATAGWVSATTAPFTVQAGSTNLWLQFVTPTVASHVRVDDITLSGDGSGTVTPPAMAFGPAGKSGGLSLGTDATGNASVTIQVTNGDGTANPLSATISDPGLAMGAASDPLPTGNGTITIPITGTPTAAGTVTVTINGATITGGNTVSFFVIDPDAPLAPFTVSYSTSGISSYGQDADLAVTTPGPASLSISGVKRNGTWVFTGGTPAGNAWGGLDWRNNTATTKETTDLYAYFTVSSITPMSLTSIDGCMRGSAGGGNNTAIYYKVGVGSYVLLADFANGTSAAAFAQIDLGAKADLQSIAPGTVITFKIVPYTTSSSPGANGSWYLADTSSKNALVIQGEN